MNLQFLFFFVAFVKTETVIQSENECSTPSPGKIIATTESSGRAASRILHGNAIEIREAPYMAALLQNNHFYCGGSLLTLQYVVSAAHCMYNLTKFYNLQIRVGSKYYKEDGQLRNVARVIPHPGYSIASGLFDVAIYKVENPFNTGALFFVSTLSLPENNPKEGEKLMISGWGGTTDREYLSDLLRAINVTVIKNETCVSSFREWKLLYPYTDFCASDESGGHDACPGDVGGPAVKNGNILVGIISYGGCGKKHFTSLYTNVYLVSGWINETIKWLNS